MEHNNIYVSKFLANLCRLVMVHFCASSRASVNTTSALSVGQQGWLDVILTLTEPQGGHFLKTGTNRTPGPIWPIRWGPDLRGGQFFFNWLANRADVMFTRTTINLISSLSCARARFSHRRHVRYLFILLWRVQNSICTDLWFAAGRMLLPVWTSSSYLVLKSWCCTSTAL